VTSQIRALNRLAVELAANGATTAASCVNGRQEPRISKGANKIFQIYVWHPVGLIICGSADLHRVSSQIIVKDSRIHSQDRNEAINAAWRYLIDVQNNDSSCWRHRDAIGASRPEASGR
jgi:hypothetical protein